MKLCYSSRAASDFRAIADYLSARSPQGAARVRDAILGTMRDVTRFPEMGRRQTTVSVRKIAVRKYPYLIYYRIDPAADEIIVLTIRHSARERRFRDS